MTACDPKQTLAIRWLTPHDLCDFMLLRQIFVIVLLGISSTTARAQDHVELNFSPLLGSELDEQKLYVFNQRASNLWCDLVGFDSDAIVKLVRKTIEGRTSVEETSVAASIREDEAAIYHGHSIGIVDRSDMIQWEGRLSDDQALRALFVIWESGALSAWIFSSKGEFRLHPPTSNRNYILCQIDPDYPEPDFE